MGSKPEVPADHVRDEVLAANRTYAAGFGDKGKLAMPPARRFAILTCLDAQVIRTRANERVFERPSRRRPFGVSQATEGEPGLS